MQEYGNKMKLKNYTGTNFSKYEFIIIIIDQIKIEIFKNGTNSSIYQEKYICYHQLKK